MTDLPFRVDWDAEFAALEEAIEQEFAALGYRPEQVPAGRAVALATLLAETGDVHRFPSVKQFLVHFGWCPTDEQSGAYKNPHPPVSKAGNRYVRNLIFMLSVGIVRHPGPYRDYFERRVAEGKKKDTLVAIGRNLLSTIYVILKTVCPYDTVYRPGGGT